MSFSTNRGDAGEMVGDRSGREGRKSSCSTQSIPPHRIGIQDCPYEILTDVFLCYLEDQTSKIDHLLLVCRGWNHFVTQTSLFWTQIKVLIRPCAPPRALVKRSVERSGECLLDIEFTCDEYSSRTVPEFDQDLWFEALGSLRENSHRWRTLRIELPNYRLLSLAICQIFVGTASNLVEFSVEGFNWRSQQHFRFTNLPKLKSLKIGSGFAFKEMATKFVFSSLQSLVLDLHGLECWNGDTTITNWAEHISNIHSLLSLEMRNTGWAQLPVANTSQIKLLRLQRLTICDVKHIDQVQFDLPSLQTLTLDCALFSWHLPRVQPAEFIWRSKGKELEIRKNVKEFLENAILRYKCSALFVVPHWSREELFDAVRELRAKGNALGSITFMIEEEGGKRNNMEMGNLGMRDVRRQGVDN